MAKKKGSPNKKPEDSEAEKRSVQPNLKRPILAPQVAGPVVDVATVVEQTLASIDADLPIAGHLDTDGNKSQIEREKIPNLDPKKLYAEMKRFLNNLKDAVPPEKHPDIQKLERFIAEIAVDIGLEAEELKMIRNPLSDDQQSVVQQALTLLPVALLEEARQCWNIHLKILVDMLQKLGEEGFANSYY